MKKRFKPEINGRYHELVQVFFGQGSTINRRKDRAVDDGRHDGVLLVAETNPIKHYANSAT